MIYTHSAKVCLGTEPCDLRKSFDSLSVIVREQLKDDPLSRKIFVFINKARNRIKLLYWDGTGWQSSLHKAASVAPKD
jgi:transposase